MGSPGHFWHVDEHEGQPYAFQFFVFQRLGPWPGQFWHVDGHEEQPYNSTFFLFFSRLALGRAAFGTSMGSSLAIFQFGCFSKRPARVSTSTDMGGHSDNFLVVKRLGPFGPRFGSRRSLSNFQFFISLQACDGHGEPFNYFLFKGWSTSMYFYDCAAPLKK